MTAREMFRVGDRVRLSELGEKFHPRGRFGGRGVGTVTEFTRDGGFAWVLWDGAGSVDSYPGSYLELIDATPPPERRPS
jgi:hypothetical protein